MRTFKKIKWDEKEVFFKWTWEKGPETQETELTSRAKPHEDFRAVLAGLRPYALAAVDLETDIDGVPLHYGLTVRVQSVSFSKSEKTGIEGCVITMLKTLRSGQVFIMNTPYLKEQAQDENDNAVMSSWLRDQIEELKTEAEKYINGKRHDASLFDSAPKEAQTTAEVSGEPVTAIVDPPATYGAPVLVP